MVFGAGTVQWAWGLDNFHDSVTGMNNMWESECLGSCGLFGDILQGLRFPEPAIILRFFRVRSTLCAATAAPENKRVWHAVSVSWATWLDGAAASSLNLNSLACRSEAETRREGDGTDSATVDPEKERKARLSREVQDAKSRTIQTSNYSTDFVG